MLLDVDPYSHELSGHSHLRFYFSLCFWHVPTGTKQLANQVSALEAYFHLSHNVECVKHHIFLFLCRSTISVTWSIHGSVGVVIQLQAQFAHNDHVKLSSLHTVITSNCHNQHLNAPPGLQSSKIPFSLPASYFKVLCSHAFWNMKFEFFK